MLNNPPVIAILDDESKMRSALGRLLRTHDFIVLPFATGEEFMIAAQAEHLDCLLLDLHMPQMSGFDVLASLSALQIELPVIVITGHDEIGNAERIFDLGAKNYLLKPVDESTLLTAIEASLS